MILKGDHHPPEENIHDSNSRQYLDDMSESTIHSPDDNTVQLSLPDSFDETLTVNGIQIIENLQRESQQEHVHVNKAILRVGNHNESSRIKSDWIEEEKKRLFSLAESSSDLPGGLEYNYDRLKFLPKERMTILDAAAQAIQTKVTKLSGSHRQEVNRLRDQIECLEHELGEVKRSKKTLAQRFESLESELMVSNGGKLELNSRLRELHEQILQYKVMQHDFEATKVKLKATEDEKDGFHRQLELKEKNLNEAASAGRESMQKLAESERKVQSMISEKVLLQKETDLILERAERLEKDFQQSEARLSAIRSEYEDAMRKAKSAEEKARADWEAKLASEMSRVRQESSNDVSHLFKHRIDVWERENTLLRESKKDLQKELEQLKRENIGARETYDTQLAQNIKTLSEKEHEIVEVRCVYSPLPFPILFRVLA
jgi:chromosome segregation ATPase